MTTTRPIWIKSAACGLLMVIGSLIWFSKEVSLSVAVGAVVALANFWLLEYLIRGMFQRGSRKSYRLLLSFLAKGVLVFGGLALVVKTIALDPVPLLVGLSAVVMGIVWEGLVGLGEKRTEENA